MANYNDTEYSVESSPDTVQDDTNKQNKQSSRTVWWIAALLLLLILITTLILLCRSCAFAPTEQNSIFLVPSTPGVLLNDSQQIWGTENHINLFEDSYWGDRKDITVRSENGDSVIAPGTESEYTFNLKNTGNVAMDYSVSIHAHLALSAQEIELKDIPIGVRLRTYSGEYLLGDGKHWVPIHNLKDYLTGGTLSVNNYAWYTLEWKWLYEEYRLDENGNYIGSVSDEWDTLLGNISADTPLSLLVSITTTAEPCADAEALGGIQQDFSDGTTPFSYSQIGGRIRLWPILLILLLLLLLIIIAVILYRIGKKDSDEVDPEAPDEHSEEIPDPEETPDSNETTETENEQIEENNQ